METSPLYDARRAGSRRLHDESRTEHHTLRARLGRRTVTASAGKKRSRHRCQLPRGPRGGGGDPQAQRQECLIRQNRPRKPRRTSHCSGRMASCHRGHSGLQPRELGLHPDHDQPGLAHPASVVPFRRLRQSVRVDASVRNRIARRRPVEGSSRPWQRPSAVEPSSAPTTPSSPRSRAGADSTSLVAALAALRDAGLGEGDLVALHVDHGLRAGGELDAACAMETCERLAIPFRSVRVEVGGGNVQASARRARYRALREEAARRGATRIATGHTRSDQAETFLHARAARRRRARPLRPSRRAGARSSAR